MQTFETVFSKLKALLQTYEDRLVLKVDKADQYYLDMPFKRSDGYVYAFGGVHIKKNYVSYYLMPVYSQPKLLNAVSEKLKKRMQGKSCFNFKVLDDALLLELKELTEKSFASYQNTDFSKFES